MGTLQHWDIWAQEYFGKWTFWHWQILPPYKTIGHFGTDILAPVGKCVTVPKCSFSRNCLFFQTSAMKILKYEQLKFTINVNNKKWLFHDQKKIFDVISTKIQFSMIFGKKTSVFANFFALKSVGRFWI